MAEIEVMNVMDTGAADAYLHMPMSARKEASFDMCLQAVRQLKKEGKDFFLQKRYERVRTLTTYALRRQGITYDHL